MHKSLTGAAQSSAHCRLESVRHHVTVSTAAAPASQAGGSETPADLLAEFVRTGICLVQPPLTPEFHQAVSAKTRAFVESDASSAATAPSINDVVADDTGAVLRSPAVHDALAAILGPDFVVEAGMAMHLTNGVDQTLHKDGTNLGFRDHRPTQAILMYYPAGADEANGMTVVLPSSQYFSCDRGRNFVHSEDRLQTLFEPPLTDAEMSGRLEEHYIFRAGGLPLLSAPPFAGPPSPFLCSTTGRFERVAAD